MENILFDLLANYNEVLSVGLYFVGTVLAVFLTIMTLPIQNILSRYSQDFVGRVKRDWIFIGGILSLVMIFVYDLSLFALPKSLVLIRFSFAFTIISCLILILLIIHSFFSLDIRNHIKDMSFKIRKKIVPLVKITEKRESERNRRMGLQELDIRFKISDEITEWLKENVDTIFDVIQISVQENRFEVVEAALINVSDISREYVLARKDYQTERDSFFNYLDEKLLDIHKLATIHTHPRIILSVVDFAGRIAVETLKIKPIRARLGENYTAIGFVDFLSRILESEVNKETSSAPARICDQLINFGKLAFDSDYPMTTRMIVEELRDVSLSTMEKHFLYGDYISARANMGMAFLLDYIMTNIDKVRVNRNVLLTGITSDINKVIEFYLNDDYYPRGLRQNLSGFIGANAEHGIVVLCTRAFQLLSTDEEDTLEVVESLLKGLNQSIVQGMQKGKSFDISSIIQSVYSCGIQAIFYSKNINNEIRRGKIQEILSQEILRILYTAIQLSFSRSQNADLEYWKYPHYFSSLIGIMVVEDTDNIFTDVIEMWVKKLTDLTIEKKGDITIRVEETDIENTIITHPLSMVYQHLRMIGVWIMKQRAVSSLNAIIKQTIKEQPASTIASDRVQYVIDGVDTKLYPSNELGFFWKIKTPYMLHDPSYFDRLNRKLYDIQSIRNYEKYLRE